LKEFAKHWGWIDHRSMLIKEFKEVRKSLKKILSSYKRENETISNEFLVRTCLLENISFQLPATAADDPWIGLREWIRNSRKIFSSQTAIKELDAKGNVAVIGGYTAQSEAIVKYIEFESGEKLNLYFGKAEWPQMPKVNKLLYWILWSHACMPFVLKCLFSKYRANWALLIRELNDTAVFMFWLKFYQIKRLYDFLPYELESNWISWLCFQRGIEVVKIPSSGPLATHNSILISDKIVFSSPYHFEELKVFNHSIRYKKILKWGPERAFQYINRYQREKPISHPKVLGFYSHASWVRLSQDHSDVGMNIPEAEELLLKDLSRFVTENPNYSIRVFLHPREKAKDVLNQAVTYYGQMLGKGRFHFANFEVPTTASFEEAEIALSAFSTILFERLFCGYKTMIGNYGIPSFPINGSDLNHICFGSYERMSELIVRFSLVNELEFFEQTNLVDYLWNSYPSWCHKS